MTLNRPLMGSVNSSEGLRSAVEELASSHPGALLLFRGQNNLHPTVRSGLTRPDVRYQPDVDRGFSAIAGNILGHGPLSSQNVPFRKVVLQHYGYPTNYVDVTTDPLVAAWFATHTREMKSIVWAGAPLRHFDTAQYVKRADGTGYVLVLVIPHPEALKTQRRLFDISTLEPFVRPSRQKAWLLYDRPPLLPDPNDFWVATIAVDCSQFVSDLSSRQLFPIPAEDPGYKALLSLPFVELPGSWIPSDKDDKQEKRDSKFHLDFGVRALPIPEYEHPGRTKDEYDHKWNDLTLTEPRPMQEWVCWDFNLAGGFPGIAGNVKEATKITISPRAASILFEAPDEVPLRWPSLGSDELFFTFAQFGHDKVDEIEYPYRGVWLHRDRDLVFEHEMTADEETMNVHSGHVYEFIGEELLRQDVPLSCKCNVPETHDARVKAMLRLSALIEMEGLILVPHPFRLANWYFAL